MCWAPLAKYHSLTYIDSEKYHKSAKHIIKSKKQNYMLNPYMDDVTEIRNGSKQGLLNTPCKIYL